MRNTVMYKALMLCQRLGHDWPKFMFEALAEYEVNLEANSEVNLEILQKIVKMAAEKHQVAREMNPNSYWGSAIRAEDVWSSYGRLQHTTGTGRLEVIAALDQIILRVNRPYSANGITSSVCVLEAIWLEGNWEMYKDESILPVEARHWETLREAIEFTSLSTEELPLILEEISLFIPSYLRDE